jgi:tetratricopeptide (TPR) repeat protein
MYRQKGERDAAIADYNTALSIDPSNVAAYIGRGLVYADRQQYKQARADWTAALELDPGNTEVQHNLSWLNTLGY